VWLSLGENLHQISPDPLLDIAVRPTNCNYYLRAKKFVFELGRGDRIRTCDPLLPKQVLYQAEPHPDGITIVYLTQLNKPGPYH
jgi:hypothetical protein